MEYLFLIYKKHKKQEINCDISVAKAAPNTPILNTITKSKSRTILTNEEKIKKYRGVFESPSALIIPDRRL